MGCPPSKKIKLNCINTFISLAICMIQHSQEMPCYYFCSIVDSFRHQTALSDFEGTS